MRIRTLSLLTLMFFVTGVMGCETTKEHKGATTGAAVGAATGAVAGAVLGSKGAKTEMAVVGGLVGALIGGAIGHYAYDQKKSREETEKKYDYKSASGVVVRLEESSVAPSTVKPGEKVDLKATYAVLTPAADTDVSVTEVREIKLGDELVGKPEVTVTRKGGTYSSSIPLTLPSNTKKGTYTVTTTIQTATAKDTQQTTFVVN